MKKKTLLKTGVLSVLVLGLSVACIPSVLAHSAEQAADLAIEETAEPAVFEKTEVVYATLTPEGATKGIYVVNQFDVGQAGEVLDYGPYSTVANLTDQGAIDFAGGEAMFSVGEGAFYYQGNVAVDGAKLPWDVHLSYKLNGVAVSPEELAGESGALSVHVTTSPAAGVDQAFYKSYMLQISFTLNGDTTTDIVAEGATVASAGRNRTVAFTVLPGRNADCVLSANVTDFEMSGVQIAALPYSMAMEMPGTDGLTEGIGQLSGAIDGISSGADALSANGAEIVAASGLIGDAMASIALALPDDTELGAIKDVEIPENLPGDMRALADKLESTRGDIANFVQGYSDSINGLDAAIGGLYGEEEQRLIDEALLAVGEALGEDSQAYEAVSALAASYAENAAAVKSAYDSGDLTEIEAALKLLVAEEGSIVYLEELLRMGADLLDQLEASDVTPENIGELVDLLRQFANGYGEFHEGLVLYMDGVSDLAGGISQLNEATIDLPATMRAEIEAMMADYEFPEFDPISFVDSRNNANMAAVQFVLTTEAIEVVEPEAAEEVEEEEQTVVDRFFALFQ